MHRTARLLAPVLLLAACGEGGTSLVNDSFDATVRLTLAGTGSASVVIGLESGSPSPDVLHTMTCTLIEGSCERAEDLDDDVTAPDAVVLTVTAVPQLGTTLQGWSGDCTPTTDPQVARLVLGEERLFTCTATFDGPPANAERFQDHFPGDSLDWEMVPVGTFNGISRFWLASQCNPTGCMGVQHALGEWLYQLNTYASYAPGGTGAVDSIVYQEDRRIFFPAPDVTTASLGAVAVIRQGGVISAATLPGDVNGQFQNRDWQTRRAVLRAADFSPLPDFGIGGAPMEFGFGRRDEWRTGTLIQYATDNWSVTVYHH